MKEKLNGFKLNENKPSEFSITNAKITERTQNQTVTWNPDDYKITKVNTDKGIIEFARKDDKKDRYLNSLVKIKKL